MAVAQSLAEERGFGEPPDPLDDDRGRRERERDVRVENLRRRLERVLPRLPLEGGEDDLLDEALHFGVDDGLGQEPLADERLAEPRAGLAGDLAERPREVVLGNPTPTLQKRPDALGFPGGRRRPQLTLLEEETTDLVGAGEIERPLPLFEKDATEDLGQRDLLEPALKGRIGPDPNGRILVVHGMDSPIYRVRCD